MILETHNKLGEPKKIECTRLLVRHANGTPIMAAMQMSPEQIWTTHCGEANFDQVLRAMGLKEIVVNTNVGDDAVPTPPGELWTPE